MSTEVVPVRYGVHALQALADAVADAKEGEPLRPVTVVVASNYAGVAARRALARRQGIAGVSFVTPYRLAELLAGPTLAATGRVPLSSPVLATALRSVLGDHRGMLRPVAEQPATIDALRRVHRELRDLTAEQLASLADGDARASAVVEVDHRVTEALAGRWFDETDLTITATRLVETGAARLGPVIVHLPQRLSASSARLLSAIAEHASVTVIIGLTGDAEADRPMARVLRRLGVGGLPRAPATKAGAVVQQIVAADPDDEVRTALRRVVLAAEEGTPLERMVIAYPPGAPYGRLLHDHLTAAGLPWNGAVSVPLAERVAGRALLGVLDLDATSLPRQELFALLASLPVRSDRPVALWERHSRRAGVVGGSAQWQERLDRLADELRGRASSAADDSTGWHEADVTEVEALRRFVVTLADHLRPPGPATWAVHARWAHRLLALIVGGQDTRQRWSRDEQRAADRVEGVLDRLARLDAVTSARVDTATFRAAVDAELEEAITTVGRLGEGLFIGPLPLAIGIDADLMVVLGMVEGGLPGAAVDDPLISDRSRRRLDDALPTARMRREELHHQLLAAGDAAGRFVVASRPRADLRSGAGRYRSRWVDSLLSRGTAGALHEQASFQGGLLGGLPPASEQEALLGDLQRVSASGRPVDVHPAASRDPALRHALVLVRARDSQCFTEFDGNLATLASAGAAFLGETTSPTALEAWATCPFGYFVRHVLGVRELENPEDELSIRPTDRGTLIHLVLEDVVAEAIAAKTVPEPRQAWPRARLEDRLRARCEETVARGQVGRALHWRFDERRLHRLLDVFVALDGEEREQLGVTPAHAELGFGEDTPFVITLPSGRTLALTGKVDRIDASPDRVVVIDYKTSGKRQPWSEDPLVWPLRLQLPIYGLAARRRLGREGAEIVGEYWHLHHEPKRQGRRRVSVDDAVEIRLYQVLEVITDGIRGGVFVAHPDEPDPWRPWITCAACDPDGMGTATGWRQWQHKRAAAELRTYAQLVGEER